jgi:hypothetical protein
VSEWDKITICRAFLKHCYDIHIVQFGKNPYDLNSVALMGTECVLM